MAAGLRVKTGGVVTGEVRVGDNICGCVVVAAMRGGWVEHHACPGEGWLRHAGDEGGGVERAWVVALGATLSDDGLVESQEGQDLQVVVPHFGKRVWCESYSEIKNGLMSG